MKPYTKLVREAIVAVLRQSYPMPLTTWDITCQMPWQLMERRPPLTGESLRALERKGAISRTPRDPDRRDRHWTYLPDPKVDTEIQDLDRLLEMS